MTGLDERLEVILCPLAAGRYSGSGVIREDGLIRGYAIVLERITGQLSLELAGAADGCCWE